MILAMLPAGLAWPCAIAALVPGVPELVHMVGAFLAVILLGVSFTLGRRAFRAQLDGAKPQEAEHGVGALSADERARRLKKLREERAGRQ
jgi:divalent metal cation (Fe/Co/Zn/Cd) transporter